MRHMRSSNQIIVLNEVRETLESENFHSALVYVFRELPVQMQDAEIRKQLISVPLPREFEQARTVANFFENLGLFTKRGVIDRSLTCDIWGDTILRSWRCLGPLIANRRKASGNKATWENFEYLAVVCRQFKVRHPSGTYPRSLERMEACDIWPETP